MQEQKGNELYAELLKSYDTLMKICTEIALIRDPSKRNQEFIAEEVFTRTKTLEIASTSPSLVVQGISQRSIEIEAYFTLLAKRNRELVNGKRSRVEDDMDTLD
jgi:hypothetical protein